MAVASAKAGIKAAEAAYRGVQVAGEYTLILTKVRFRDGVTADPGRRGDAWSLGGLI